ncbi:HNH endonuclease [Ensifer sp. ENS03]|uniref:HNH endonuclease n=1 Tax=Ensifer sp. ENS03 TaxID=2769283 RepID=UPI00177D62AA|nr:HNH endonuclease [Ensifer sp. ENS03]MBD9560653.1 HNH endonuclease [Ensifer sp. ENS03]
MRAVDRKGVFVPDSLQAEGAGPRELKRAQAHQNNDAPQKKAFPYAAYKGSDVKLALETLFHGKCAYCETRYSTSAPVDIEHYRPKGAVAEAPLHGGYWWIAMDWENLLPSCIDCNRRRDQVLVDVSASLEELAASATPAKSAAGKKDSFPLADERLRVLAQSTNFSDEGALLLDPCRDDPAECLTYNFDPVRPLGLMVPAGDDRSMLRGAVSIQVYGLNRLRLVQDRTEVLRRLEFLASLVADISKSIADLEEAQSRLKGLAAATVASRLRLLRDRTISEMKSMASNEAPYASMAKRWLETFKKRIAGD